MARSGGCDQIFQLRCEAKLLTASLEALRKLIEDYKVNVKQLTKEPRCLPLGLVKDFVMAVKTLPYSWAERLGW